MPNCSRDPSVAFHLRHIKRLMNRDSLGIHNVDLKEEKPFYMILSLHLLSFNASRPILTSLDRR